MRITNQMLVDTVMRNLQRSGEEVMNLQESISSGKRVARPSDDPAQAELAVRLRSELTEIDQHLHSIALAQTWLGSADTALQQTGDLIQRARELVVQAKNSYLKPSDRQGIGAEVSQLLVSLRQVANTRVAGRYVFSGFRTDLQPFPAQGTYAGDSGDIGVGVDSGVTMAVNLPGDRVFQRAFDVFADVAAQLAAGREPARDDTNPAGEDPLEALDGLLDANNGFRAEIGARENRLDAIQARLQNRETQVRKLDSDAVDMDMSEGILRLTTAQSVYQAALGVAGRTIQPTLLDFLR